MKAFWGMSTEPMLFIRFLPSFCFAHSFFFREMDFFYLGRDDGLAVIKDALLFLGLDELGRVEEDAFHLFLAGLPEQVDHMVGSQVMERVVDSFLAEVLEGYDKEFPEIPVVSVTSTGFPTVLS